MKPSFLNKFKNKKIVVLTNKGEVYRGILEEVQKDNITILVMPKKYQGAVKGLKRVWIEDIFELIDVED